MNPDTNEIVRVESIEEMRKMGRKGFIPLPQTLCKAANQLLGNKKKAIVSKTSGGKLSKWAAKKRRQKAEIQDMIDKCNNYYFGD